MAKVTQLYCIISHQLCTLFVPAETTIFHSQLMITSALLSSFRPPLFRTAKTVMLTISLIFRPYKDETISIISTHYLYSSWTLPTSSARNTKHNHTTSLLLHTLQLTVICFQHLQINDMHFTVKWRSLAPYREVTNR